MSELSVKVTVPDLARAKQRGEKLVALTAYDTSMARLVDAAGADIILVGDSLGMVVLGHPNTLSVTMDEMIHHARAVSRGVARALTIGDMPWMSYHVSPAHAVVNAARFIQEAGMQAVKIEGGRERLSVVHALLDAEIPVMGHLGLTPQSYNMMGGFKVQGKRPAEAEHIREDAIALEQAGVFAIVLECVPADLAAEITAAAKVPTIGIGAGPHCDGQILVLHDMLGMDRAHAPRFVRRYGNLADAASAAIAEYAADVRSGAFPNAAESYSAEGTPAPAAIVATPAKNS